MAVSIEAAFVLLDKASKPLKDIQRQAGLTDKALRDMGGTGSTTTGGSQLRTFSQEMDKARTASRSLGSEVEKTARKVDDAGGIFKRTLTRIDDWRKSLDKTHPVLTKFAGALGGVIGGLKGVATAFPPIISAALIAAPAIVALAGAVGALGSSLAFAAGGGALLGGGLLGSFAVGLGSIATIAKPAITATQNYHKAVLALNTALASGSPTRIRAAQQQLDAISKANPGVAKLSDNLTKFHKEWVKATAPGRADFFKLATDGMKTMRDLLPTLAGEANKNTAALQESFNKILQPFLESSTFKGLITGLGGIFRANLPGFMNGLVNIFSGLANILKVLTPQLDKAGGAFQGFTQKFANWTATAKGRNDIRDMGKAFHSWMSLLKGIARLLGDIMGVAGPKGTSVISGWADKINKLADKLALPGGKQGISSFFDRSLGQAGQLAGLLKPIASDLKNIYNALKPLGSTTAFIIKNLPAPAITALMALYVGIKGSISAIAGFKAVSGLLSGGKKGISALTSGGGIKGAAKSVLGEFEGRGSPTNPMYVVVLDPGGGGGASTVEKILKKAAPVAEGGGAAATAEGVATGALDLSATGALALAAAPVAEAALFAWLTSVLPRTTHPRTTMPRTPGNPTGTPGGGGAIAGRPNDPAALRDFRTRRTASNRTGFNPVTQASSTAGIHFLPRPAAFQAPPTGSPGLMPIVGGKSLDQINQDANQKLVDNTHKTVDDINNEWLLGSKGVTGKWKDTTSDVLKESDYLHTQMHSKNQALAAQAKKDWTALASAVDAQANGMTQTVISNMANIAASVQSGSATAATSAQANFGNLASTVQAALKSGAMNSGQAAKLISQSLNAMLRAFGQAPIPNLGSVAETLKWENWWQGGGGHAATLAPGMGHQATGGRLPGEPRGDHLPLFGRGGSLLGIADGGELVVNRHTEAKADGLLAMFGTRLSRLVAGETKPHTAGFAKGGRIVTASDYTGTGSASGRNAATTAGFAELSNNYSAPLSSLDFSALGHLPMGTILPVTYNGKTMRFPKIDVGAGGAGIGGHQRAIDLTYVAARELGFPVPGLANVIIGNPAGINLGGGGGGARVIPHFPHIRVPGSGTMQRVGQGYVNALLKGANRYIDRHEPAPATGAIGAAGAPGGPSGTVLDPSGKAVAKWIEPILQWARAHGWRGVVTSGFRTFAQQAAINASGAFSAKAGTSNHETTQYPGGAVDVSDPSQLIQVLQGYRGPRKLIGGVLGPVDPEHFSATGHALGGRLPWYRNGADFVANRPQVIGVGDGPTPERVTVTPTGQGRVGNQAVHIEIHKIEVNRKGDVQKIVDEELRLLANSLEERS